ncbi:hypothetical protein QNI15_20135 [Cytophagaceae bacterium NT2B1]|nr:hypothetical protein [Xanthocytophaga flavus]
MNEEKINNLFSQVDELQQVIQMQQELILHVMKDIRQIKTELRQCTQKKHKSVLRKKMGSSVHR